MPNLEATKKAEARRKAREAAQEAAARQARADLERKPSDTAAARIAAVDRKTDDTNPDPNTDNQAKIATNTPGIVVGGSAPTSKAATKAAQKRMTQMAAEEQAKVDAARKPQPVPDNYRPGDTIPLNVLNQRAKQDQAEARDEAMAVAAEVSQFAYENILGKQPRTLLSRSRRMRDAMILRDTARAKAAAKKD